MVKTSENRPRTLQECPRTVHKCGKDVRQLHSWPPWCFFINFCREEACFSLLVFWNTHHVWAGSNFWPAHLFFYSPWTLAFFYVPGLCLKVITPVHKFFSAYIAHVINQLTGLIPRLIESNVSVMEARGAFPASDLLQLLLQFYPINQLSSWVTPSHIPYSNLTWNPATLPYMMVPTETSQHESQNQLFLMSLPLDSSTNSIIKLHNNL